MVHPSTHEATTRLVPRLSLVLGLTMMVAGVLVLEVLGLWLERAFLEFVGFRSFFYVVDIWELLSVSLFPYPMLFFNSK